MVFNPLCGLVWCGIFLHRISYGAIHIYPLRGFKIRIHAMRGIMNELAELENSKQLLKQIINNDKDFKSYVLSLKVLCHFLCH